VEGRRILRLAGTLALSAVIGVWARSAPAASIAIEVDGDQAVTINGSSDSLRAAIAELCQRANVKLVAYEAPDRPFAASYQQIPLSEALGRLLRSEIFLVGLRPSDTPANPIVTWLRVSGSTGGVASSPLPDGSATAPQAAAGGPSLDLGVAQEVIDTALSSQDTFARNNARRTLLEALRGTPAPLERFLDTDVNAIVDQVVGYQYAAELLNSLQSVTTSVEQRTKIQTMLRTLRLRQDADRRKAAGDDPG
jgi:hypothetical protein